MEKEYIKDYDLDEIVERLGAEEGFLLGMTEGAGEKEKLVGLFEGMMTFEQIYPYLNMPLPENWVFVEFVVGNGKWNPKTILALVDFRELSLVKDQRGDSGYMRAALDGIAKSYTQDRRMRSDRLRHNAGEAVYPCNKCGEDFFPEGILKHRC